MRANPAPSRPRETTFTGSARRAQIVAAAIETLAEVGYAQTSFAQIARRAGLRSTGLISYHFANKEELVEQVLADVLTTFADVVRPRVDAEGTAAGAIRAYLVASVEFVAADRRPMLALLEIAANAQPGDRRSRRDRLLAADLDALERVLRDGQVAGEFRPFDPRVVAVAIRAARDGVLRQIATDPRLEPVRGAHELADLFAAATRKETS